MDPLFWVVALSAALSVFFSTASYSLRLFRRVPLEEAFDGLAEKPRLLKLEKHLVPLRLTTSFCRSVANLVLVVSLVYLWDGPDGWPAALQATVTAAVIIAIFGVAIPQSWASYAGEKFLAATLPALLACEYILYPAVAMMRAFDMPVRRLAGAPEEPEENGDSAKQEILQVVSESRAEGAVDADEVEMIESVMEFADTHADQIMTPRTELFALPAETPWAEARSRIVEAGHTRVPVYEVDLDNIVGILYAKDLLRVSESDTRERSLRETMRKPYFVPETIRLDDLLREFKVRKVHLAVVLDEYGGTAGLVTIEDVLEEIVGEISDEYDRPEPVLMTRIDENTIEVDGRVNIDDLNDLLDLKIPEDEDYDTVAGFVFSELGYIPEIGEQLEAYGARFHIQAADERKITRIRIEQLQTQETEQHE